MPIEAINISPCVVSTLGGSFYKSLLPGQFSNYEHRKRANGGNYRASFTWYGNERELERIFRTALAMDVQVYNHRGKGVWDGMIYDMEYTIGGFMKKVSLAGWANRVWMRYYNGSDTVRSTTYNKTKSQDGKGIREVILTGAETSSGNANQACRTYLNRVFDPYRPSVDYRGMAIGIPTLRVYCRGYWDTLYWRVYNQTGSSGDTNMSTIVAAVIADVGDFIASTRIETNATQVEQEIDADRWAGDYLVALAGYGDSEYDRWVTGVDFGREFYFIEAAESELPEA